MQAGKVETRVGHGPAYAAIHPDSLARFGYVRYTKTDSIAYYGPDDAVLLSDSFLDTHCFTIVNGKDESRGLIGVAFEPTPKRRVPDINGTMWIDPATSERKYVEFRYTGVPSEIDQKKAGGHTNFRRLPNGMWIVDREDGGEVFDE